MNAHTTQLLAEHRTNGLHAEADNVRLARQARTHRGETGPGVVVPPRDADPRDRPQRAAGADDGDPARRLTTTRSMPHLAEHSSAYDRGHARTTGEPDHGWAGRRAPGRDAGPDGALEGTPSTC